MSDHGLWAPDAVDARLRATQLRVRLRINAAFSAVTGIVGVLAAGRVARTLDVDAAWVVRAVGLALLAYAVDLVVGATLRHSRLVPLGRVAAEADAAWVLGTAGLVAADAVSGGGAVILGLLALPVGVLAIS